MPPWLPGNRCVSSWQDARERRSIRGICVPLVQVISRVETSEGFDVF